MQIVVVSAILLVIVVLGVLFFVRHKGSGMSSATKNNRKTVATASNSSVLDDEVIEKAKVLSQLGSNYIIFTNAVFEENGIAKTTSVDQLVLSPFGIYCIETMSYAGKIFGNVKNDLWDQYIQDKPDTLNNPVTYNEENIKALNALLGEKLKSKIHNLVIFPNTSQINVNSKMVFSDFKQLMKLIEHHKSRIYSHEEFEDIVYTLAHHSKHYDLLHE